MAQGASCFGEAFGAEEQQHDGEEDDQVGRLENVGDMWILVVGRWTGRGGGPAAERGEPSAAAGPGARWARGVLAALTGVPLRSVRFAG